ncbi:MAG: outer membrane protein assembly factor BamC [Methylovulum sp.]|jgi:uncharacterized lipoprotein|nr:outer membrane protein assembly factor BamC [Methylovulum sp.]MCF7999749.1 outer membrane protein assembly factor BamC [Methylovulum sp.]
MKILFKACLLPLFLTACGLGKDERYSDTEALERPPILTSTKVAGEGDCCDDAVIPKKRYKKGLGEEVYLTKTTPPQIKIKQPFESAWLSLGLALKQAELRITDQERTKGVYYVAYHAPTLFDTIGSLLKTDEKTVIYVLKVEQNSGETKISALLASAMEQSSGLEKTTYDKEASDDAEDLIYKVFDVLHNELQE